MEAYVIINATTNKIMTRYHKYEHRELMFEELSKQGTIFGGMPVAKGYERWEKDDEQFGDMQWHLIEKDYGGAIETGKLFWSPKPPGFINNKKWKDSVLTSK